MEKIIVVDDDTLVHKIIRHLLSDEYDVVCLETAEAALEYFRLNSGDLLLLDVNLPSMDGLSLYSTLQSQGIISEKKPVPVIVMTGDDSEELESRAFAAGAFDHIVKPFSGRGLKARIKRALDMVARDLELEVQKDKIFELEHAARTDGLTGLYNRTYTKEQINSMLEASGAGVFFMMDLDRFKSINDFYGHETGDRVLAAFAEILKDAAPNSDCILCRNGGDEFIMFIDGVISEKTVIDTATNILKEAERFTGRNEINSGGSVSIGISLAPYDGYDFASLYKAADKALYHVKSRGRNNFFFFRDYLKKNDDSLIDLEHLSSFLRESRKGKAAFKVNFEHFHSLYNFLHRYLERNEKLIQVILFTIFNDNSDDEVMEYNAVRLEDSIVKSLRQSDICTRFSKTQVLTLLMDSDEYNATMCAERILKAFRESSDEVVRVDYEVSRV